MSTTLTPKFVKETKNQGILVEVNGMEYNAYPARDGKIESPTLDAAAKVFNATIDWSDVISKVAVLREAKEKAEAEARVEMVLKTYDVSPLHVFVGKVIYGVAGAISPTREELIEMAKKPSFHGGYSPVFLWNITTPEVPQIQLRITVGGLERGGRFSQKVVGHQFDVSVNWHHEKGKPQTPDKALEKAGKAVDALVAAAKAKVASEKMCKEAMDTAIQKLQAGIGPEVKVSKRMGKGVVYELLTNSGKKHYSKGLMFSAPDSENRTHVSIVGKLTMEQAKRIAAIVAEAGTAEDYLWED